MKMQPILGFGISTPISHHQKFQERIKQTTQKINLLVERIFPENKETPFCIEKRYTIHLWEFSDEKTLVDVFLGCIGFSNIPQESIERITTTSLLKRTIIESIIPELDRICNIQEEDSYTPTQHDIDSFLEVLDKLRICLNQPIEENLHQALSL